MSRHGARLALLLLALLPASCTDDGGVAEDAGFQRVRLSAGSNAAPAEPRRIQHLVSPDPIAPWTAEPAKRARKDALPDSDEEALILYGGGDKTVRIPGTFDPGTFNRVEVRLAVHARATMFLSFRRRGKEIVRSSAVWLPSAGTPIEVPVDFAKNALQRTPYDELIVWVGAQGGTFALCSVDLLSSEYSPGLPQPGAPEQLVFLANEGRESVELSTRRPLAARITCGPGRRLGFSYGMPRELHLPEVPTTLAVTVLDSSGHELVERFPAAVKLDLWQSATIELDDLAPGPAELEIALHVAGGLPGSCLIGDVSVASVAATPPTVLLVTSDTHRADHLGHAAGAVDVTTPTLDSLAERGVVFDSCWSSSNVTIPSHAALMTGTHPRDTRVLDNRASLAERAPTLAERFRAAGFATFAVVSARHLGHRVSGMGQGFDRMSEAADGKRTAARATEILDGWLAEAEDRPLFLWLHVFDAHGPYEPPEEFGAPYTSPLEPRVPGEELHEDDLDKANYKGEISFVDHTLAALLASERMRGGIVAFTADHGESLDLHEVHFQHEELYPDTTHIPMLLAWPDAPAGTRVARRVRQIDLGRTLLDLAGLREVEFPGHSLVAAIDGSANTEEPLFAIASGGSSVSVQHDGWLLILHLFEHLVPGRDEPCAKHHVELFDLGRDPDCLADLATAEPERARRLRDTLVRWLQQSNDAGWHSSAELDDETLAELARLGYAGGPEGQLDGDWIDPDCECERCETFAAD